MRKINITQTCTYELDPENYQDFMNDSKILYFTAISAEGVPTGHQAEPPTVEQMLAIEQANCLCDPVTYVEVFENQEDTATTVELLPEVESTDEQS